MYEKMTANISMFIYQNYKGNIVISKINIDKCHTTKKSRRLGMAGDTDLPWDSWKHQTELLGDFTTLSRETVCQRQGRDKQQLSGNMFTVFVFKVQSSAFWNCADLL